MIRSFIRHVAVAFTVLASTAAIGINGSAVAAPPALGARPTQAPSPAPSAQPNTQAPAARPIRNGDEGAAPPPGDSIKEQPADDAGLSRNAARTRMRECGHQWSGMKKNGSATGLTWKEFSQGCLARK